MTEFLKRILIILPWLALGFLEIQYAHAHAQQPATNWYGLVASCPTDLPTQECDLIAQGAVGAAHTFDKLANAGVRPFLSPVGWPAQGWCMMASAGALKLLVTQDSMGAHNFAPGSYQRILCVSAADLLRLGYPVLGWDYGFCRQHPYDETCQQMWSWMQAWNGGIVP